MSTETKKTKKRSAKIIITVAVLLAAVLFFGFFRLASPKIFGNRLPVEHGGECGILSFRDADIDRMSPSIEQGQNSPYEKEEIQAAITGAKKCFKNQKNYIKPLSFSYSDEKSAAFLETYRPNKEYAQSNIIAVMCDYTVYWELGVFDVGTYKNAAIVLARDGESEPWKAINEPWSDFNL